MVIALALLLVLAGCGEDTSLVARALSIFSEEARPMNADERRACIEAEHCMDIDGESLPAIEYCDDCFAGFPPEAAGKYSALTDRVSIRPEFRGLGGLLQHECIHAMLSRRTGDLDTQHASPYFGACAPRDFIARHP